MPATNQGHLQEQRDLVGQLCQLLNHLYPDPSLEIFTITDFRNRYPLTGLGRLAMAAIEQSQRVSRAIGNYYQAGLCEFHVGLIYLYRGDCSGAQRQFTAARQQWSFVNENASICLAHFAEGCAQHLIFQYEAAMISYGKADKLLPRTRLTTPSAQQSHFIKEFTEQLLIAQQSLREAMWSLSESTQDDIERPPAETAAPAPIEVEVDEEAQSGIEAIAELPPAVINIAPPISNMDAGPIQFHSPLPAHRRIGEQYHWYEVIERKDDFLPAIHRGTWLLVDSQTADHEYHPQELVIVAHARLDGSIRLERQVPTSSFHRIYLAHSAFAGAFTRNIETGEVTLSAEMKRVPITPGAILGIVVGIWQRLPDFVR